MATVSANPSSVNSRYVLETLLGAGGMGVVYRALDRLTRNHVALKRVTAAVKRLRFAGVRQTEVSTVVHSAGHTVLTIPPERTPGRPPKESLLLLLAREFEVLSSLRHPNIISVLDYGFDSRRQPFYTMELLENCPNLLQAVARVSMERKVELLVEVLRALMYLHRRGIIHRDLKPGNVMVAEQVKLLDFGLAIQNTGFEGKLAGTVTHMAPELFRGAAPSQASDLYAVGVMAYEGLAGSLPFEARTGSEIMQAHLHTKADLNRLEASADLKAVIARLLCKNPLERYSDAAMVIEDLSRAVGYTIASETQATRTSFLERAEFVGRVAERAQLLDSLDRAAQGCGEMVLLEGQSGIGKSRLLDEVRNVALARGVTVLTGQAAGHHAVYQVWREPLRALALKTPMEDSAASVLKLLLPDLDELIGHALPPPSLPPQTEQAEILAVIRSLFERQREPLLLLLEDLHREQESIAVLEELARVIHGLPILLVGSYRGEEAHWMADALPQAQRIHLAPFEKTDIAQLVRSIAGPDGGAPHMLKFLEEHTEGNVFFIVETLRALAEEAGALSKVGTGPLPDNIAAAGMESLVEHRISMAPAKFRGLLEYAALIGREPDLKLLEFLLGRETVYDGLTALLQLLLLEVRGGTWRFSHDKFRETLVRQIDPARAPALHRAIAESLEQVYPDREDRYALMASHFGMAGESVQELKYSTLAGRAAIRQGGYKNAMALLSRALELHRQQAVPDESAILELLLNLGSVQIALRGWAAEEVRRTYDEAVELGKRTRQETAVAPALVGLSKFFFVRGELASAQSLARRCLELGEASGDPVIRQHGLLLTGEPGVWLGEFQNDQHYAGEIAKLYDASQAPLHLAIYGQNPRLSSLVASTVGTWMLGYPERALALCHEATVLATAEKNHFSEAIAYQVGAWIHQLRREPHQTQKCADGLATVSNANGFVSFQLMAQIFDGWVKARGPNPGEALGRIREGIKRWRELGATLALTYYFTILGDACLVAGADEEGLAAVREALQGKLGEERCYDAELHRLEAEFLARAGEVEEAGDALRTALRIATEQGAKSFMLRILITSFRVLPASRQAPGAFDELQRLSLWFKDRGRTPDMADAQRFLKATRI